MLNLVGLVLLAAVAFVCGQMMAKKKCHCVTCTCEVE